MKSMLVFLVSLMAFSATAAHASNDCLIVDSPNNELSVYYGHYKGFTYSELVKKGYRIVQESEAPENAIYITETMIKYTTGEAPIDNLYLYIEITLPDYRVYTGSYSKKAPWFSTMSKVKGLEEVIAQLPDCKDL